MGSPHLDPGAQAVAERVDPAEAPFPPRPDREPAVPASRVGIDAVYAPTPMQEGMLLHARIAPGSGIDLVQYVFTLRGRVDADALRAAWEHVLGRHPALRTAFEWSGGERPRQVVHRAVPLPWDDADWRALSSASCDERLAAHLRADRARGFDPARPPLLRVLLARVADDAWRLVWTHHHLLLDGWSAPLVLGEVLAAYGAAVRGEAPGLPARRPFGDYVAWLEARDPARAEAFWRDALAGFAAPTPLPPGAPGGEGEAGVLEARLPAVLTAELRSVGRRCGVTLGTLAQGAWALVLSGCSGQDDVVFGTAVSGRPAQLEGVEEMVGMFVNTVPVRARLSPAVPAAAWLAELQARAGAAREHEHAPLADVQRWSGVAPGEPLFRTLLAVENYPVDEDAAARAGFAVEVDEVSSRTGFPLTLTVIPGARLRVRLRYDGARFGGGDAERILGWFQSALQAIARAPDAPLAAIPLVSEEERRRVVQEWNRTEADVPGDDLSIHQLFARRAARTPDATAVAYGAERLTFAELHAASNRLARVLRRRGVGPEVRVGVCLERGTDAVAAILGVLAAGGAYVPLDPANPPERLAEMLRDAGAAVLVTRGRLLPPLPGAAVPVLCLDAARDEIAAEPPDGLAGGAAPGNLAYVIYTSGSTGRPKGVMVEHRSVVNLATLLQRAVYDAWGDAPPPAVSLNGPLTFDTSVKQWVRLLAGSALHVIPDEVRHDGRALAAYVREQRIDVLDCTPAQLRLLLDAGLGDAGEGHPSDVLVAGEAIDPATWRRLGAARGPRFHNLYGPTECTVDAAVSPVRAASPVPVIGRPGANVRLYVVDPWGRPVPVGVPGELWIGGAGVARGYLDRPALTAERFVPDPFGGQPGARLYRSGDRARWIASGEVEFLGRLDQQVKVRGFRIEPGEVESVLARCPGVREAAVVAREDAPGERRLVAYVVGGGDADGVQAEAVRVHLRALLPDYMVPSAIVHLDALPRTRHGKVDRAALPAPEGRAGGGEGYVPPRTPAEAGIAAIWEEVLETGGVGANDDFFALGGHSLHAARVASRIREAFGVELPLRACFEARTLAELAEAVQAAAGEEGAEAPPPLVPVPRDGELPLSFAQARLWYLDQLEPGSTAYNMATALRLRGALDAAALRRALGDLVRRHEALRTVFPATEGKPVQQVRAPAPVPLPQVDLRGLPAAAREDELLRLARAEAGRPFDLAQGPLLRATRVRLGQEDQAVLFTLHHIVSDGWSTGVLVREVSRLYAAHREGADPGLPDLPVQYADYAVWQREWLRGGVLGRQLAYWRGALEGAPPLLELPTDRVRPPVQGPRAGSVPFAPGRETADRLRALARREGATPFMVLLAAWQALLARYAGADDVLVGVPVAGRTRREVEGLIGLFVNTLVIRTGLEGQPDFRALLRRVRARVLEAQAHQELPFERLLEALEVERTRAHAPLVQVMMTLLDTAGAGAVPELGGVRAEPVALGPGAAKFDLVLALEDDGEVLRGELEYRAELWDGATVERMLGHLSVLLEGVLAAPDRAVQAVPLLTPGERERVVEGWNATATALPHASMHELFAEWVARTPDAPAVEWGVETLSYTELASRAARLAHHLRGLGVGPDARVALCLERGVDYVVGALAVLQAGGAYVSVDGQAPPERVREILADSGCVAVLTHATWSGRLPAEVEALRLDDPALAAALAALPATPPPVAVHPDHVACVIYTSGSTGRPKGVAVAHRGVVRLVRNTNYLAFAPAERIAQASSTAFDAATFEIWGALLNGCTLVGIDRERLLSPPDLAAELRARRVTVLFLTTALFNRVVREVPDVFATLGHVFFGGEAVDPDTVRMVVEGSAPGRLLHMYGPTETTTYASWYPVRQVPPGAATVPIGGAVANTTLYVVDAGGAPAPVGVPGELFIGGVGVARGYLGRPALTAERFVPDPFSADAGGRLYRTGDRVRWRAEGALEYIGRVDDQVKIRGFRIEPGEVEAVLARHAGVREAVVVVRDGAAGVRRLVAYVTPAAAGGASTGELRAHLGRHLPEYMVPAAVVVLDRIPLTPSGKTDRRALPEPAWGADEEGYEPPRTPAERVLARVWEEVLRVDRVGVHDRFFDLGGDSILSIQVVARARREGVHLTARELVEHPTLAELARVAGTAAAAPVEDAVPAGALPLTPIQRWFFEQEAGDHAHFNQAFLFTPRRTLDPAALARALGRLIEHHDALRLRFSRDADGGWAQRYAEPGGPIPFLSVDLAGLPEGERTARMEAASAALQASLDLTDGPLLRAARFDLGGEGERLLLVIHHLAVDGVSWRILLEDLQRLYEEEAGGRAADLPPKTTSFGRWARRLAEHAASGALRGEVEHWTGAERRVVPPLPVDHPGGGNRAASVRHASVALDAEETRALLQEANAAYGTQTGDLLLAALARTVGEWAGERRVLVHLEGHGREELFPDVDLSRTVGWFTSMFPVLLDLRDARGEAEELKAAKEQLRAVPAHGIGYGLLRYLAPDEAVRGALRALPAPGISFNYLGQFDGSLSGAALFALARESAGPPHDPAGRRAHLLDVTAAVEDGVLQVRWSYSRDVHRPETVEALARGWLTALRALIAHCLSADAGGHTPSDFPLAGLDAETLALLEEDFA